MNSLPFPLWMMLLKWTVLLALGWSAHWLLRHRHSRWRLILWRGLLCAGLLVPVMQFALPGFHIPVHATPVLPMGGRPVPAPPPIAKAAPRENPPVRPPAIPAEIVAVANVLNLPPRVVLTHISWERWLWVCWGLGAAWAGLRLIRLQVQLSRLRQVSRPAGPELQQQARQLQTRMGVQTTIRLRVSDSVASSFACGLLKPTILLPQKLVQDLPPDEIRALLAHEIAHFRRHDLFWCLGWRWTQAVFWFHPLIWKVPAAHSLACEQEADALASGQLEDRGVYSQLLSRLVLRVLALPEVETGLVLNAASQIAQRLKHLKQGKVAAWNWRYSAAGMGLVTVLFQAATACRAPKTQEVLEAYHEASDTMRQELNGKGVTDAAYQKYCKRWRARLLAAANAERDGFVRAQALQKVVGLSNGLNDFDSAEAILLQLAATQTNASDQLRLYSNLGEIRRLQYWGSQDVRDADKACQYMEKALGAVADERAMPSDEFSKEQIIIVLAIMAEMESAKSNYVKAVELLGQARKRLQSLPLSPESRLRHTFGFEQIDTAEMKAAIKADDMKAAEAALERLSSSDSTELAPGYYAYDFVSTAYPTGGDPYCRQIRAWLATHPEDSWTGFLKWHLACALSDEGRTDEALPLLEELKDKYSAMFTANPFAATKRVKLEELRSENLASLFKAEQPPVQDNKSGGYLAEVLFRLATIYNSRGDAQKAELLEQAFTSLVPNDPRVARLPTKANPMARKEISR